MNTIHSSLMKKTILILLTATLILGLLGGCKANDANKPSEEASLKIVTTIFPEYDWARELLGENPAGAEVIQLLDNGIDLHSFQPTAADILKVSTCDLFIYVGGESDAWVEDALKEAVNEDMIAINLLEVMGDAVKEEELVPGMEEEEEEEEEPEYDEHVWLSLRNASLLCEAIADALKSLDPAHAPVYEANLAAYQAKLSALDAAYLETVESGARKTILFGDRFPFRYLADDYGLTYYAAFAGCSAETEASFETILFLANQVDAENLPCVLQLESANHRIAETVVQTTADKNQKVLTMDSMQSATSRDAAAGKTYLSIMEDNLAVLREALN